MTPGSQSAVAATAASARDIRARLAGAGPSQLLVIRFYKARGDKKSPIGRYYEGLVREHADVVFLDAYVDRNPLAVGEMGVGSVPTFMALKNHKEVGRYVGTDERDLLQFIRTNK